MIFVIVVFIGSMEGSTNSAEEGGRQYYENKDVLRYESMTPLFGRSSLSRLDATLLLMNMCRTHKVMNTCINELLNLLLSVILSSPNLMPSIAAMATIMFDRLG